MKMVTDQNHARFFCADSRHAMHADAYVKRKRILCA